MRQVVLIIGLNALVKPVYLLGIERAVQNKVGTEAYGIFFVLFNFIYLFQILNDFGIQQYNNRFIAQNRQLIGKYFPKLLKLKFSLTGIFIFISLIVGWLFGYVEEYPLLFAIVLVNHAINALFLYLRSNISGLGFYTQDSILSALDKLLLIFIILFLFWYLGDEFSIYHFVAGQTVSLILASFWAFWLLRKRINIKNSKLSTAETQVLFKRMLPFGLVLLLGGIYTRIDAVMIEILRDDGFYQSGMYAAAYRLLNAFNMMGFLIAGLLYPMYSRALKENHPLHGIIKASAAVLGWMAFTVALIFYFYGGAISDFIYTDSTVEWGRVLAILMLTIVPQAIDYMYGSLLIAAGKLRFLNRVFIFTILVNIGLNLWLIPVMGAYGAALTTVISQLIVGVAFAWKCHTSILENSFLSYWGRIFLLGIILLGLSISLNYTEVNFIYGIVSIGLVASILVFGLGIIRIGEIKDLISFSNRE